jgi:predicted RNA-binding Zn-ribbon protein involved in translation (DUF1610 family)
MTPTDDQALRPSESKSEWHCPGCGEVTTNFRSWEDPAAQKVEIECSLCGHIAPFVHERITQMTAEDREMVERIMGRSSR